MIRKSYDWKILALAAGLTAGLALAAIFILSACIGTDMPADDSPLPRAEVTSPPSSGNSPTQTVAGRIEREPDGYGGKEGNNTQIIGGDTMSTKSTTRIKMTFGNEEVFVRMNDNPTSRDFLKQLPLTLTLKDYAGTEKISYLPKKISTKDAPAGSDPDVGDFAYYSPWGNLAIYYRDFGYSDGLIILGSLESGGEEKLARMNGDFIATLERAD